jgi:hypothetical protein
MSEIKRKVKATRRLSEATHGVTSLSLTAILTAAAADLYEQRRPKTVAGCGKRARGGLGKTGANEPGRFSPPAYPVFGPDVLDQLDGLLEQARME